jgi:hypothetical protein
MLPARHLLLCLCLLLLRHQVGDVKRKLLQRQIYASDGMGQKVTVHDAVTLQQGPLKGKLASIQAIFKQWLFAICREHPHNGGWVCVPARETRRTGEAVNGAAGGGSSSSGGGWAPQSPGRNGSLGGDRRWAPCLAFHVCVGCSMLCCAVLCCAVLCCAVLCCAVLCCAVLRCA